MFKAQSLALYKNRPVLLTEVRDKIEIRQEDGSTLRVRDKDLHPLHPGPVSALPSPARGGDFETARKMLAGETDENGESPGWAGLAELVFGADGPEEVMACWKEATDGLRFRLDGGLPYAVSDAILSREMERRARKEGEAEERTAFIERVKKARSVLASRRKNSSAGGPGSEPQTAEAETAAPKGAADPLFLPDDERFFAEIEGLALARSTKSRLCGELGIPETAEGAHAFLLSVGRWSEYDNPHARRAGCPLWAPKLPIGDGAGRATLPERRDLSSLRAWAIDNAWSHDPDDAVGWDGSSVWVHVADPASVIIPGSDVDAEALSRGSTLYLPELTAPMLPDEALERFGLGLSDASPALSIRIGLDGGGAITAVEVVSSTLKVERLSYAGADALLDAGTVPELSALASIAELRAARRAAQGAVEIAIPEVRVHVERGVTGPGEILVEAIPHYRSSELVRELMLLAGEAVARWAFERSLPFPYYGQEAPGEGGGGSEGDSLSAQFARRRLMRSGLSGPTPSAHRGLGLPFYAQATSPLRRYQDLLGHMQIRAHLEGREALDADEVGRRCALAQAASAATRQAERASELHWTLAYLRRRGAWGGEGVIVGAAGPGSWQVYLPELGLETKLKLGSGRALDEILPLKLVRVDLPRLECSFDEQRSY
ncbi:MAG TPA: ribonuclease catalytic domain-containing protein [Rectinemataceae bacterium]|nr:ribonuclease catalytic domain-containing protein [Rectinemataceae bacterium]